MVNQNIPFIRFNHLWDDKIVMTNIFWDSIVLWDKEFDSYINWWELNNDLKTQLEEKMFFKTQDYEEKSISKYKRRNAINFIWPTLHIIVLTKWCNHQCKYCHAAADYRYTDDSLMLQKEDAEKIIDIILSSPSKNLNIEFQWWEPIANFEILEHIVNYTEEKNRQAKKNLKYSLVSNLTLIDEKILKKLLDFPNFNISTSIDWDKKVHDFNRFMISDRKSVSSFDTIVEKIKLIREKENDYWKKILFWAMWVITSKTLPRYKELVDTYIELWFDSIFLKKINWIWYAEKTKNFIWYSKEELFEFYNNYYSYLIEKNKSWKFIRDWFLDIIITKITNPEQINFMDLRSPCWAWIWQIAYDYTWKIYTCDEWRMIDDDVFMIWDKDNNLQELVQNDIVWAMMDSSIVESLPCDVCAYAPFCWVCPIESYQSRWNIYTNQIFDEHCWFFMFLFDYVFKILHSKSWDEYEYIKKYLKD